VRADARSRHAAFAARSLEEAAKAARAGGSRGDSAGNANLGEVQCTRHCWLEADCYHSILSEAGGATH
jgi:hypothetical protein